MAAHGFCFAMGLFLQLRTGLFFAGKNLTNVLEASSFRLLLAIGMTFIIAAGAIDLSVGAILSLSAILAAKCMQNGMAVPAAVLLGLLAGTAMGTLNGALVHFTGINAFIITLATSLLYRGLALVVTLGTPGEQAAGGVPRFWLRGFWRHGAGCKHGNRGTAAGVAAALQNALGSLYHDTGQQSAGAAAQRCAAWTVADQRLCTDGLSFSPGGDDHHGTAQFRGAQRPG